MRNRKLVLGLAAVVLVLATSCGSLEGLEGAELYANSCAACHGADGSGGSGPAVGAGSDAVSRSDAELDAAITAGVGRMPGYGNRLTSAQIDGLVDYMRELQMAP